MFVKKLMNHCQTGYGAQESHFSPFILVSIEKGHDTHALLQQGNLHHNRALVGFDLAEVTFFSYITTTLRKRNNKNSTESGTVVLL
jgi:hypothetical protein